ncbi:MerR family transcriptional regulator [Nocardia cyriacigeorgica]|uniref:MerR family transcriptional regulator n=1 Tax=Nocardia cyriacigeorgica TaxID=135487 RepID=UPI002454EE41|nr:MerR family transcriptional regulator [Nocardia cyriacigeorgica]
MRIGELSRRTGVSPRLLRYYEARELIVAERSANGYREYGPGVAAVVVQIRALLGAGLTTEAIREILPCAHGPEPVLEPHPDMFAALTQRLAQLDTRIAQLNDARDELSCYLRETRAAAGPDATDLAESPG